MPRKTSTVASSIDALSANAVSLLRHGNDLVSSLGKEAFSKHSDVISGLKHGPGLNFFGRKKRLQLADERWHEGAIDESIFDSPLQQALHLLRELATSLEASKDGKRLGVVKRVMDLLHAPNLNGSDETVADHATAITDDDAQMVEWLGPVKKPRSSLAQSSMSASGRAPTEGSASGRSEPHGSNRLATDPRASGLSPTEPGGGGLSEPSADLEEASSLAGPLHSSVRRSLLPEADATVARMLSQGVGEWHTPSFDALELHRLTGEQGLAALGWALYTRHGWHQSLGVSPSAYTTFLQAVQAGYQPVAYHNAAHATDVTHGVHWLLSCADGLRGVAASPLLLFSSCVAAMVHDCGHDGRGNAFHIASSSELAMLYSDQSPLEMHHCAMAFRAVQASRLLDALPLEDRQLVRAHVIDTVLATDFGHHTKILNEFKLLIEAVPAVASADKGREAPPPRTWAEAKRSGRPVFSDTAASMSDAERLNVSCMVIKVADLSYPSKGRESALCWIDRCLDEFLEQGDREQALGLPVSYSRETLNKAKSQVGFFTFFVVPMYEALARLTPLATQIATITEVIDYWKERLA